MIEVDVQRNKVNSGVWCVATAEENSVRLIKKKRWMRLIVHGTRYIQGSKECNSWSKITPERNKKSRFSSGYSRGVAKQHGRNRRTHMIERW